MKAVIPAAGLGTRFLPYTKAQPKEMLPVIDKPAIQYVVEEAVASGLRDILVVTGRTKRAIEDHFDASPELLRYLRGKRSAKELYALERLRKKLTMTYIRQPEPLGLGDAVLYVEPVTKDESFALLLGDDILVGRPPCMRQLLDEHRQSGASVVAVQRVPRARVPEYGMVEVERDGSHLRVIDMREKPRMRDVTSTLIVIGRYVLTPSIFPALRRIRSRRRSGELQLTDAIRELLRNEEVHAVEYRGRRYDIGSKLGWLEATIDLALRNPEYRRGVEALLR